MKMANTFSDFIRFTSSQKEISLIIAKDEVELASFVKTLKDKDFKQTLEALDLFKYITTPSKVFFVIQKTLSKDMYDFMVQYPTGQVEIYDKFNLKSQTVIPIYKNVSVIFIITKETLKKIQESGFHILEQVGITYQN
jgi:hypothetical protein